LVSHEMKNEMKDKMDKVESEGSRVRLQKVSDVKRLERGLIKALNDAKYDLAQKFLETALRKLRDIDESSRNRFVLLCLSAANKIIGYNGVVIPSTVKNIKPSRDYLKAARFFELAAGFNVSNRVNYINLYNAGMCYQSAAINKRDQFKKAELLHTAGERFDSALKFKSSMRVKTNEIDKVASVPEVVVKGERDVALMMSAEAYLKASFEFSALARNDENYNNNVNECLLKAADVYARLNEWERLSNIELNDNYPKIYGYDNSKKLGDILIREIDEADKEKDMRAVAKLCESINHLESRGLISQEDINRYSKHKAYSERTENIPYLEKEWDSIKDKPVTNRNEWIHKNNVLIRLTRAYVLKADKTLDVAYYHKALKILKYFNDRYKETFITDRIYAWIKSAPTMKSNRSVNEFDNVLKRILSRAVERDNSMEPLRNIFFS